MTTKKKGRPPGSPNKRRDTVEAPASRCRQCGSTNRTPYHQRRVIAHGGTTDDGQPYTHTVWRWTSCADCGAPRVDRTFENRTNGRADAET